MVHLVEHVPPKLGRLGSIPGRVTITAINAAFKAGVAHGASKRRWAPQTARNITERSIKSEYKCGTEYTSLLRIY